MANCVTCGAELHPERAQKYDYCTRPDCRAKNARPRTIVSIGVNKAADQFVVLDDRTTDEMASGRYRDPGRTSSARLGKGRSRARPTRGRAAGPDRDAPRPESSEGTAETWTREEQNLALAYDVTGRLPLEEIARRLDRDPGTVARMLVAAKARWRLPAGRRNTG